MWDLQTFFWGQDAAWGAGTDKSDLLNWVCLGAHPTARQPGPGGPAAHSPPTPGGQVPRAQDGTTLTAPRCSPGAHAAVAAPHLPSWPSAVFYRSGCYGHSG